MKHNKFTKKKSLNLITKMMKYNNDNNNNNNDDSDDNDDSESIITNPSLIYPNEHTITKNIKAKKSPIEARGISIYQDNIKQNLDDFFTKFEIEDEYNIRIKIEREEGWDVPLILIIHLASSNIKIDIEPKEKSALLIVESPISLYKENLDKQLIPRIIHQTFVNQNMPKRMEIASNSWSNLNPEYQYNYFTNRDCRNIIKNNFHKDILEAYDILLPGAYKADLWRYCVLYLYGGVYADIAMVPKVALRDVIEHDIEFISPRDTPSNKSYLYNAFMASKPKHPIILQSIKYILDNVKMRYYSNNFNTLIITGPGVLGRATNRYLGKDENEEFLLGVNTIAKSKKKIYITEHLNQTIYKNTTPIISTKYKGYSQDREIIAGPHYSELYFNRMIYCENIMDLNKNSNNVLNSKIPNSIYQTFQTNYLSKNLKSIANSWSNLNPNYTYKFILEKEHLNFISDNFGNRVIKTFKHLDDPILKLHLWKYCYLYTNGGIISEINYQCLNKLDEILQEDIDFVLVINKNNEIYTNFIASIKQNPILLKEILRIVRDFERYPTSRDKITLNFSKTLKEFVNCEINSLKEGVYDTKPIKLQLLRYDDNAGMVFKKHRLLSKIYNGWHSEKLLY